jgi:hypothetical protein
VHTVCRARVAVRRRWSSPDPRCGCRSASRGIARTPDGARRRETSSGRWRAGGTMPAGQHSPQPVDSPGTPWRPGGTRAPHSGRSANDLHLPRPLVHRHSGLPKRRAPDNSLPSKSIPHQVCKQMEVWFDCARRRDDRQRERRAPFGLTADADRLLCESGGNIRWSPPTLALDQPSRCSSPGIYFSSSFVASGSSLACESALAQSSRICCAPSRSCWKASRRTARA